MPAGGRRAEAGGNGPGRRARRQRAPATARTARHASAGPENEKRPADVAVRGPVGGCVVALDQALAARVRRTANRPASPSAASGRVAGVGTSLGGRTSFLYITLARR